MIIVARLAAPEAAEQLSRLLQTHGIQAVAEGKPNAADGSGRVRDTGWAVEVDADQFPEAILLLRDLGFLHLSPWEASRCPKCGSLKSKITKSYYHDISWPKLALFLFLLGLPLLLRRPRLHCFDCGHVWPKPKTPHVT